MIDNLVFLKEDNYTNSQYDTLMLEYDLYLAEKEAFNTLNKLDKQYIQESQCIDTEILNESIKETLTLWIGRFTEAIQRALNKFTGAIEGAKDLAYLKSIEGKVRELNTDPGFTVSNIRNYNSEAIRNFKVVPFMDVYNTNKDSLQSNDQFLVANYSNYGFANGQTNIKEVLETALIDVVTEPVDVTAELIRGYYNWCRNDYTQDLKPIQDQMNTYNNSIKSISNLVAQLPDDYKDSNQTTGNPNVTQGSNQENPNLRTTSASFIFTRGIVVTEDETTAGGGTTIGNGGPKKDSSNPGKMTFDNKVNYVAKNGGGNQEAVNAIRTYLGCTTKILSTMMIIVKNRKADYMRVLKHLFPVNREMRDMAQSTTNINRVNRGTPQVNTSNLNTT